MEFFIIIKFKMFNGKASDIRMNTESNINVQETVPTKNCEINNEKQSSEQNTGFVNGMNCLSSLLFIWTFGLIKRSQDSALKSEHLPKLTEDLSSLSSFQKFEEVWKKQLAISQKDILLNVISELYKRQIVILLIFGFISHGLYITYPILIYYDIDYIENDREKNRIGIMLFLFTTVGQLIYNIFTVQLRNREATFGVNLVNSVNLKIYQKALRYPIISSRQFTEADIINYSQIDADSLNLIASKFIFFIYGVIEIIAGVGILYAFIGYVSFISLGLMVLVNAISFKIGTATIAYNMKGLETKDERINATDEMLNIIKHIKINASEKHFFKKINRIREVELQTYKDKGLLQSIMELFYNLTIPCILSVIFFVQYYTNQEITAAKVFATIALTHIFQETSYTLPRSISEIVSIINSIKRIEEFLIAEEIDDSHYDIQPEQMEATWAIDIKHGDFYSNSIRRGENQEGQQVIKGSEPQRDSHERNFPSCENIKKDEHIMEDLTLLIKNIDLTIEKGKFYMVFGDIGSGKSTLLLSMLNQFKKSSDTRVRINGSLAYVSQKPWVMCETLENNICFTFTQKKELLDSSIESACLLDDVKILPEGSKTMIGESGINLSGGQKARVSLGRAFYSSSDIYLFDDVLSAVDVHVGEFLLRQSIRRKLKGKTVVMVTHAIQFAQFADRIILLQKGRIIAEGDYQSVSKIREFREIEEKIKKETEQKAINSQQPLKNTSLNMITKKEIVQNISNDNLNQLMLQEDQEDASLKPEIIIQYIRLNGGFLAFFLVVIGIYLIFATFQTIGFIHIEKWSDSNGTEINDLYYYIGFTISSVVFIFFVVYIILISSVRQGKEVHTTIMKHILYSSYTNFFNRVPIGRIINRLSKDLKELDEIVGKSLSMCLIYFVQLLSAMTLMIYCSTYFASIPLVTIFVLTYFIRKYYKSALHQVIRLEKISNSPVVSGFTTAVTGLTTIRAYKQEASFIEMQAHRLDENKKILFNKFGLEAWFQLILIYLFFGLNVFCIGFSMFSNSSNSSKFGLLLTSILNINDNIYHLILQFTNFEANLICLERLYHFMNLPVEPSYNDYCEKWDEDEEVLAPVIKQGLIEFRNASIRYRDDLPNIVSNLSVTIKHGEKVGIVGRTGSGKSTIINALIRITEVSAGSILIDNVDIKDIFLKSLRSEITVIDQEPVIIESTFRENLDLLGRYSDDELLSVLKECNILGMIEEKGGLEGRVDKNSLSMGEKQLLCICRAFLKDSKIILIDEATASIDVKNDALIQSIIASKFQEKTVLTIAHRLTTISNYDKIIVLDKGVLIEFGSPSELLQNRGIFFEMLQKYEHRKSPE